MKGGNEPIPCFVGYMPGWDAEGNCRVSQSSTRGGPRCYLSDGCHCFCSTVDCWDGPDGEPIVHHGYTLTSKILFKDVIETINKYAFVKNEYVCSLPTFESQGYKLESSLASL